MTRSRLVAVEWKRWERRRNRPPRCLLSLIVEQEGPQGRLRHFRVHATIAARSIEARVVQTARTIAGVRVWLPALRQPQDVVSFVLEDLPGQVRHIMRAATD
jgi:hypothetical protein